MTFANGEELVIDVTDAPAGGIAENYVPNTAEVNVYVDLSFLGAKSIY